MNDELSNKILAQIETKNLTPLPSWRFYLWRGFFWLLAILSVIVGSLAVGAMLFLWAGFFNHGLLRLPHSFVELLLFVPYLWLLVLVLFIVIARISIRQTKKGYHYRLREILFGSLFLSLIFGTILALIGVGKITDELFREVPAYNFVTYDAQDIWNRPMAGRLAGVVLEIKDKSNFSIVDFHGHIWFVHLASSTEDVFIPEASSTIRMLGIFEASSSRFMAESLSDWSE